MEWRRGRAYAQDLRKRVLEAAGSARAVAQRFGVSASYVVKACQRQDRTGQTTARPQRSHVPRKLADLHDAVRAHVEAHTDITLDELRAWLTESHSMTVSTGLMWNTLNRLGLTLKKSRSTPRSKPAPTWPKPAASGVFNSLG